MRRRRSYSCSASISAVALTTIALMAIVTDGSIQNVITESEKGLSGGQNYVETSLLLVNYSKWSDNTSSTGSDNGASAPPSLMEHNSSSTSRNVAPTPAAADSTVNRATMSSPSVSALPPNKLGEAPSERHPSHSTASLPVSDTRHLMSDSRSSVHLIDYGIDVREELRTAEDDDNEDDDDDGNAAVNGDIDSLGTENLQSISIKSQPGVSNLINFDPINRQQLHGIGREGKEMLNDSTHRKSTSLFDDVGVTNSDDSSTTRVNHFAGGEQPPLNLDRNSSKIADGGNERLGSRGEGSSNSWAIINRSTFNETQRSGASYSASTSPDHDIFSLTPTPTTMRPLITPTSSGNRRYSHSRQYSSKQYHHDRHWGPFFEDPHLNRKTANAAKADSPVQVSIHLGTEAFLNCRVGMLRDKTVMWVRKTTDKVSLLTVGNNTYSGDSRISIRFQYPNNWRLKINPVQEQDVGLYMCQVSTHPPIVFATNVTILAPAIRVVDEHGHEVHDRYYKMGSVIDLTCQIATTFLAVQPSVAPPPGNVNLSIPKATTSTLPSTTRQPVFPQIPKPNTIHMFNVVKNGEDGGFMGNSNHNNNAKGEHHYDYLHQKLLWRKDNGPLPKDVQVNLSATPEWRNSRISIQVADRTHSGVYSCSLMDTTLTVVNVQVLTALLPGEMPAAVQHNGVGRPGLGQSPMPIILILLFYRFLLSAHIC